MNHLDDDDWDDDSDLKQIEIDNGRVYHCNSCGRDVARKVRIHCMECENYDACILCFAGGKETNSHKRSHSYRVLSALDFSIFESSWAAAEELALVDGIEIFGLGNWEQVAQHVGTKNLEECSSHWIRVYHESEDWPFSNMCQGVVSPTPVKSPSTLSTRKKERNGTPIMSCPESHEIQGYMPVRNEFCIEFENDAEQSIKDLEFCESDTPLDVELKLAMLSIYNSVLDKRQERKRVMLEYDLMNLKFKSKEEREIYQTFGVFWRMQSPTDLKKFVSGLLNEMSIRQRIVELQECRRMGFRTKAEIEVYKSDKINRIKSAYVQPRPLGKVSKKQYYPANQKHEKSVLQLPKRTSPNSDSSTPQSNLAFSLSGEDAPTSRSQTQDAAFISLSRQGKDVDIPEIDESSLLAPNERQLCKNLKIYPKAYLAIKETILRVCAVRGNLRMCQARKLLKIDVNKTNRIYSFFVEMGWIKAPVYSTRRNFRKKK